jgi:transcription termination factor NusB
MVDYSKKYLLDNKYKFINGMLEKISGEYAKTDI